MGRFRYIFFFCPFFKMCYGVTFSVTSQYLFNHFLCTHSLRNQPNDWYTDRNWQHLHRLCLYDVWFNLSCNMFTVYYFHPKSLLLISANICRYIWSCLIKSLKSISHVLIDVLDRLVYTSYQEIMQYMDYNCDGMCKMTRDLWPLKTHYT